MKHVVLDEITMSRFWRSVRALGSLVLRTALIAVAVASLCLASVVWASGAFATPLLTTSILAALAVSAAVNAWALARLGRLKAIVNECTAGAPFTARYISRWAK